MNSPSDETWLDWLREPEVPSADRWAITGVAMWGAIFLILGPVRSFKSWAAIHLIRAALDGTPWLDREVGRFDHVYYIGNEKTRESLRQRMKVVLDGLTPDDARRLHLRHRRGLTFGNVQWQAMAHEIRGTTGKVLVLVDTVNSLVRSGHRENVSDDGSVVLSAIRDLMTTDDRVTVGLVGHPSGDNPLKLRGWTGSDGEVDSTVVVARPHRKRYAVDIEFIPKDDVGDTIHLDWDPVTFGFTPQTKEIPFGPEGIARVVAMRWDEDGCTTTNPDLYTVYPDKGQRAVRAHADKAVEMGMIEVVGSTIGTAGGNAIKVYGPPPQDA
jgi:hypothetical protein